MRQQCIEERTSLGGQIDEVTSMLCNLPGGWLWTQGASGAGGATTRGPLTSPPSAGTIRLALPTVRRELTYREPKWELNSWASKRAPPTYPTKKGRVLTQRCSPGGRWPPLDNSSPSCVQWGSRGNSRPLSSGWRPGSRGRHSCLHLHWKRREIHAQPRRKRTETLFTR